MQHHHNSVAEIVFDMLWGFQLKYKKYNFDVIFVVIEQWISEIY